MQRAVGLGADLAEDQHHEGEEAGADRDPIVAPVLQHDHRDEHGGEIVDEIVAEQDQPD